ncbi:MAG: hypothetical protein FWH55_08050 [Oscillospiraceae bacterium]|nr:hypothetical protein [Oscillospiraceae bacterium]
MRVSLSRQIQVKIELLCYGLRTNALVEGIYIRQNPYDQKRTGNVGIQILLGEDGLPVNIPVFHVFVEQSPYELVEMEGSLFIKNSTSADLMRASVIDAPNWYMREIPGAGGKFAGDYLLVEGSSTLIVSITESCLYAKNGRACSFCAIGQQSTAACDDVERRRRILAAIDFAFADGDNTYSSINFTGGNSSTRDRGIRDYVPFIKHIREKSSIPICLEISPPMKDELDAINECFHLGVNAFMMNLELWDDQLRKLFMPAKATIQKDEYYSAWERAIGLVGKGKVSSVLIIGLENERSTMEAIEKMTSLGVIPSIMPLRPNNGAILENYLTTQPSLVASLTHKTANLLIRSGINMDNLPGCIGCGACAAEQDEFHRLKGGKT